MMAGVGEFMADAGETLLDAGAELADAGADTGRAQAQEDDSVEVHQLRCDESYSQEYEGDSGAGVERHSQWFARVETSTVGISGVDVILCGRIAQGGAGNRRSCNAPDCTGTALPPAENCRVGATADVDIGDGFVRVSCGEMDQEFPEAPEIGVRFENAKVTIRRD
jgi:hypothetical protein